MSTEELTLDEAIERGVQRWRDERVDNVEGARYVGSEPTARRDAEPADAGCCRGCGEPISSAAQRVVGDNYGRVPACTRCSEFETVAAAALDARTEGMLR